MFSPNQLPKKIKNSSASDAQTLAAHGDGGQRPGEDGVSSVGQFQRNINMRF